MLKTSHTPGPWRYDKVDGHVFGGHAKTPGEAWIADPHCDDLDVGERESNARLIAAAPDLLEALQEAADYMADMGHPISTLNKARKAIAKVI